MSKGSIVDMLADMNSVEVEAFASAASASAVSTQLKENLKRLLQVAWEHRVKGKTYTLAKHHACVDQFELEQLWGLLQVDNQPARKLINSAVKRLSQQQNEQPIRLQHEEEPEPTDTDNASQSESESKSEPELESQLESESQSESESESNPKVGSKADDRKTTLAADEDDDEDDEEDEEEEAKTVVKGNPGKSEAESESESESGSESETQEKEKEEEEQKTPELDDEFFKFEEMEKFTEQMEELDAQQLRLQELYEKERAAKDEAKAKKAGDADAASGDEFSESEEEEEEEKGKGKEEQDTAGDEEDFGLLYNSMTENEDPSEVVGGSTGTRATYSDFYGQGKGNDAKKSLSSFEKRQALMREKLRELEAKLVQEKEWDMRGEAAARSRPQNSLLEKGDLDVKYASRPAPVVTEEVTESIEDLIKRRIAAEDYDDVVRKLPKDVRAENTKDGADMELSTEKSKRGLGEEYAKAYEKQVLKQTTVEEKAQSEEHEEIQAMFSALCNKLNALTNFHYTPKPPKEGIKVTKKKVAAIQIEEATPMLMSTADAAAPEELYTIQRGKDSAMGKSEKELTQEERKRLRQARKAARRKRKRQRAMEEKVVSKLNFGLGNKHAKESALRSLRNQTNIHAAEDTSGVDYTKSQAFFNKLQAERENLESSGAAPAHKKRGVSKGKAIHFKL